jgi:hypothetical protein
MMHNLIVKFPGKRDGIIVLASHYETSITGNTRRRAIPSGCSSPMGKSPSTRSGPTPTHSTGRAISRRSGLVMERSVISRLSCSRT